MSRAKRRPLTPRRSARRGGKEERASRLRRVGPYPIDTGPVEIVGRAAGSQVGDGREVFVDDSGALARVSA